MGRLRDDAIRYFNVQLCNAGFFGIARARFAGQRKPNGIVQMRTLGSEVPEAVMDRRARSSARTTVVLWKPRGAPLFACHEYWRRRAAYASQFLTPGDRAHRNIRRIEARLSPVNPHGEDDGCFYRPKGMRLATFERLWGVNIRGRVPVSA